MSLASYRYGSDYLSIGRVQTPTLRLVVDRELERRAFVPVPYWEIKAELEAASGERFTVEHAKGRFAAADAAEAALAGAQADTAEVTAYATTPRSLAPPAPFNTTALMSAASGAGIAPSRAMKAAESLYLDGLISYPAHRQHGLPALARPARRAADHDRPRSGVADRRRAGRPGHAQAHPRQKAHHRPSADLPGRRAQGRAARRPGARLRPRRAALPGHPAAGGRHRGPAPRRAARQRALRGARQPYRQARLPARLAALHLRPRAAPAAGRRGRRAGRARRAPRRQGDAAALALRARAR